MDPTHPLAEILTTLSFLTMNGSIFMIVVSVATWATNGRNLDKWVRGESGIAIALLAATIANGAVQIILGIHIPIP